MALTLQRSDLQKAQTRAGYLFILPSFTLYAVFVLAPVVLTFVLSFTYYDPMAGSRWVGLENFERFFTGDRSLQIFWNTLCFAIFAVAGNVTVGLLLALALNRAMPSFLLYLFRLAYFLPVIIAAAFVSIVWGYFYGDDLGVINYYLIRLGFAPVHWLTSSRTAMMSIVIMDVWKNAGFFMIIFIAALQGVPKSIMDAAIMDEPSYWRRFFRIILRVGYFKIFIRISLPQLRPALSALGIITFTQTWNYYFQARVLLEPQPAMTLPIAMDLLRGYLASGNLSVVMAAMSMAVLPVILIFLLAQRLVIEGVTLSGIKN